MNAIDRGARFRLGQPASDMQVAERMRNFFDRAPELKTLESDFLLSIEAESLMRPVEGQTAPASLPHTLKAFLAMPADQLTEDVLREGARLSWPMCNRSFTPEITDYAEIVSRLYERDRNYLSQIHSAFISDLMAAEFILYGPERDAWGKALAMTVAELPQLKMGPLFAHAWVLVGAGIHAFGPLYRVQLNESILADFYKENVSKAKVLCPPWMNKAHILEKIVQEGLCPSKIGLDHCLGFPIDNKTSLSDCLTGHQKLSDHELLERTAIIGLIKRHPLKAIMDAAKSKTQKRALAALFPANALLKRCGNDHVIKGMILEDSLGL
jgi:hypothetical protein